MTTVTLRPNGTIQGPGTLVNATSAHAALSDDSNSSYIQSINTTPVCELEMGTTVLPAGARVKAVKLGAVFRSSSDPTPIVALDIALRVDGATVATYSPSTSLKPFDVPSFFSSAIPVAALTQAQIDGLRVQLSDRQVF